MHGSILMFLWENAGDFVSATATYMYAYMYLVRAPFSPALPLGVLGVPRSRDSKRHKMTDRLEPGWRER